MWITLFHTENDLILVRHRCMFTVVGFCNATKPCGLPGYKGLPVPVRHVSLWGKTTQDMVLTPYVSGNSGENCRVWKR